MRCVVISERIRQVLEFRRQLVHQPRGLTESSPELVQRVARMLWRHARPQEIAKRQFETVHLYKPQET